LTCVFLATKTENFPISIDTFSSRVKTPPTDILSLEFLVSQSLRFEYKVHHAHLALNGILLDLQVRSLTSLPHSHLLPRLHPLSTKTIPEIDPSTISSSASKAQSHLRTSRHTSLELLYTPSQIALSCLSLSSPSLAHSYLLSKTSKPTQTQKVEVEKMERLLNEVGAVVKESKGIDKERVKDIDKRLKWARNPEKDPSSAL